MKYQLGDTVLILHSNEEGQIVDFINKDMAVVDVKGVRFPVYLDQIDFPYFKRFTEKKSIPQKKEKKYVDDIRKEKKLPADRKEDGVWLTFLPVMDMDEFGDPIVRELKLHLVNHTGKSYHFIYKLHFFGKSNFELKNEIHPFEDFYIHDVDFENMNDNPSFDFEFRLTEPDKRKVTHYETSVRIKPKQLFARIKEIQEQNKATFSQLLFEKYPDKLDEPQVEMGPLANRGYKIYDASKGRQHAEPARGVIDLHVDKLTDDWRKMSNHEILTLQLKTFEKYYQLSLVHHQPSLVVIHGVGEGVLRDEIHDRLRLKKEVKSFVNQYHPNYGWGATEIYFQY